MAVTAVGSTADAAPVENNQRVEMERRDRAEESKRRDEVAKRESPPDRGRVEQRNSDGDRAEVSRGR